MPIIGHIDQFSPHELLTYMDPNSTQNHRNYIPSPTTFAVSVAGNFHAIPWLGD